MTPLTKQLLFYQLHLLLVSPFLCRLVPVSPQLQVTFLPTVIGSSSALLFREKEEQKYSPSSSGSLSSPRSPYLAKWLWPIEGVTPGATRDLTCPASGALLSLFQRSAKYSSTHLFSPQ